MSATVRAPRWRRFVATVLVVLGGIALAISSVGWWVERYALNSGRFTELADDIVNEQDVQLALTQQLVKQLSAKAGTDLQLAEPFLSAIVAQIVQSDQFDAVFRTAVRNAHHVLVDRDTADVVLNLEGVYGNLRGAVNAVAPKLAAELPKERVMRIDLAERSKLPVIWDGIDTLKRAVRWLTVGSIVLIGAGIAVSPLRWRTLALTGWVVVGVLAVLLIGLSIGRRVALGKTPSDFNDAVESTWRIVVHGLVVQSVVLVAVFGVVALLARWTWTHGGFIAWRSLTARSRDRLAAMIPAGAEGDERMAARLRQVDMAALVDTYLASRLPSPKGEPRKAHAWRAVLLGVVGLFAVFRPSGFTTLIVVLVGLGALYLAIAEGVSAYRAPRSLAGPSGGEVV